MKVLKRLPAVLGAVLIALLLWGLIEPYFLDVEEYAVPIPDLPPAWEGRRIAFISDWQLGMWMANESTVRRSVEKTVRMRPDIILIGGDFVYKAEGQVADVLNDVEEALSPLTEAGILTYAVLGNHDFSLNYRDDPINTDLARAVAETLEQAGVRVLENEAVALRAHDREGGEDTLYVVGIGARWPDRDRPRVALRQVPEEAPRVLLMHNPNSFKGIPEGQGLFSLAGHTHGGQVRLPFTPFWSWLNIVAEGEIHVDGWIEPGYGAPGNRLYVNRGIGFSVVPIRINCMPEVTLFTLTRDASRPVPF